MTSRRHFVLTIPAFAAGRSCATGNNAEVIGADAIATHDALHHRRGNAAEPRAGRLQARRSGGAGWRAPMIRRRSTCAS